MACLMAILLGTIAFIEIPIDLMPETDYPTLSIHVSYPGVAPQEMETLVARPREQSLAGTPGAKQITSSTSEGRASVRLEFAYGSNLDEAAAEMRSRLERRRDSLPDDIEPPTLYKYDVSQYPIIYLTISSPEMDPKELRYFSEKFIQHRLERVDGVAASRVSGGLRRQIHVNLALKKLRALNLSVSQVVQTLRNENLNRPVGPVREGRYEVLVRTEGEFHEIDDMLNVAIAKRSGVNIYLRDIATVEDAHEDVRYLVSVDGQPAVRVFVYKQSGANTVEVSQAVRDEIAKINRDYDRISVTVPWDTAEFIQAAIDNVKNATIVGGGLAVFVLLFFLRSLSSTLIIGVAIPVSVISTFALMYFNGFTLNTVSFGGLALGVGMLVDNAIVVLENIYRHREEGLNGKDAALLGASEVAVAITASTLTTIAVFVPVLFIQGVAGQTFKQLAWVVSFALACSLLVAITVVPMLCSRFLRAGGAGGGQRGVAGWIEASLNALSSAYEGLLRWALGNRLLVTTTAVALFVGAVYIWPLIGVELEPELDEGSISVNATLEPGTRVDVTDQVAKELEQIIRENVPEVRTILTEAGSSSSWRAEGTNKAEIRVYLVERSQRDRSAGQIAQQIRPLLQSRPGMMVQTRVRGAMRSRGSEFGEGRLSVEIRGHDMDLAKELADEVLKLMLATEGVASAELSRQPGMPEMVLSVDRQKASSLGLSVAEVADTMETAIGGTRASMFREEGDEFDILVRLAPGDRIDISQLDRVSMQLPDGSTIPAGDVVKLVRREGPVEITRADQQRIIVVSGVIEDRDLGSVVDDLREKLAMLPKPAELEFVFGGEYEQQQEAFRQMTFAALLALALVYMVMAAQFESLRDPFIILFSIPLAFVGVAIILLLTETTFNMQGFLGVIILVGIVVNNAIVLVDYTNCCGGARI